MDSYLIRSQLLWGFTKFKSYEQSFVNVCTWQVAEGQMFYVNDCYRCNAVGTS